jgi:hypothetical protein
LGADPNLGLGLRIPRAIATWVKEARTAPSGSERYQKDSLLHSRRTLFSSENIDKEITGHWRSPAFQKLMFLLPRFRILIRKKIVSWIRSPDANSVKNLFFYLMVKGKIVWFWGSMDPKSDSIQFIIIRIEL